MIIAVISILSAIKVYFLHYISKYCCKQLQIHVLTGGKCRLTMKPISLGGNIK